MSIRILLADGHSLLRQGLSSLFAGQKGMEVIAQANNGIEAVDNARRFKPDVVIINVVLSAINGIDATRYIVAAVPNVRVIALTASKSKRHVREMFDAGASAYVLLESGFNELVRAVETAVEGHSHVSPVIGGMCIREWMEYCRANRDAESILTQREREVLQLLAEGNSSKQIASTHHVSLKTVEAQRRRISEKLEIFNIAGLTKYAIREGLTPLD
jgi:two-component system, NarL family, response regulator NreC